MIASNKEVIRVQICLTQRGPLHGADGRLVEAGYATSLIKTYDRARIKASPLRIKEWDYYLISNDSFVLALTVADNGYMGLDSISFIDLDTKTQHTATRMVPFPMGRRNLPANSAAGRIAVQGKQYSIDFKVDNGQRHLFGHMYDFKGLDKPLLFDVVLTEPKADSIVMVTPFARRPRAFYYNQKIPLMPAEGRVVLGDQEYLFSPASSFGTLDWGRGVWTYSNTWYWSSASGIVDGHHLAFNFGYGFGDTSKATENMLFADGVGYKLEHVVFDIPQKDGKEDYLSPWRITDNQQRVDLVFTPILDRASDTNFILLRSDQHQVFGRFSGIVRPNPALEISVQNLTGFAEKVRNKW